MSAQQDSQQRAKQGAATLSLVYNTALTIGKVVVALLSGSMSLLTEAAHSGTDIVASGFAFVSVRASAVPPDEEHNYGHGKAESLAGFGESVLLLVIVVYVLFEAFKKFSHPAPIDHAVAGMVVMTLSALSNLAVARHVTRIARESGSLALQSNSQHLMVDFWTSVGVLTALVVTSLTKWPQADPLFAVGLAIWIGRGAWRMCRITFDELMDHRLTDDEVTQIRTILSTVPDLISYHKLRTRRSGNTRYIEVHLVVPSGWSVIRAHELADVVEKTIQNDLAPAIATIHVDPDMEESM